jgi:hypothetical protein
MMLQPLDAGVDVARTRTRSSAPEVSLAKAAPLASSINVGVPAGAVRSS